MRDLVTIHHINWCRVEGDVEDEEVESGFEITRNPILLHYSPGAIQNLNIRLVLLPHHFLN